MNIVDQIALRASAERVAVISGDQSLTFGELLARAGEVASWLRKQHGFSGGIPRVGLSCENGVDYIIIALGILKAGGCLVPLADELTPSEKEEVIQRTALRGIIHGGLDVIRWNLLDRFSFDHEDEFEAMDPAFIRFSSGTTGRSKGVVLSHAKLRDRIVAANAALEIGPADRILWMLPMAHHFAVSIVLYLYHSACTVLGGSHLAGEVLSIAAKTKATVIYGAPFHFSLLAADQGGYMWPDLRLAVSTAAPLREEIARSFAKRFEKPLVQGLGIIEVGLPLLNTGGAADFPTAVGRPLPSYDVELRDEEGLAVPAGRSGELWIKGPGMFDSYLSPWQPVAEVCVDEWFATGDLAEMDAGGRIFLKGRSKSVMNVSGMKVFPEEVENVIDIHPEVVRSRVYGETHAVLGTVVVADVIVKDGAILSARDIADWCKKSLSIYKVPVRVSFVSRLPMTASGKIRRV